MVQRLKGKRFNRFIRNINATPAVSKDILHVKINDTVGLELDYDNTAGTYGIDILELPFYDNSKGVSNYSHAYPPCLIPTAIRLMKDYVEEHGGTFQTLRKYERENDKNFFEYFEKRTGIPYDDLIMYEP